MKATHIHKLTNEKMTIKNNDGNGVVRCWIEKPYISEKMNILIDSRVCLIENIKEL